MKKLGYILMALGLMACENKIIQYPVNYDNERAKFLTFSQDRNKQILEEDNEMIQSYIDRSGIAFSKTSYGFWLSNSGEKTASMAKTGDHVQYRYEVADLEGQIIYSEEEIGTKDAVLGKENLTRGLHISLQLIEKGDSATALYPSFIGHGTYGDQNKIKGDLPLVYKIKILDIQKKID